MKKKILFALLLALVPFICTSCLWWEDDIIDPSLVTKELNRKISVGDNDRNTFRLVSKRHIDRNTELFMYTSYYCQEPFCVRVEFLYSNYYGDTYKFDTTYLPVRYAAQEETALRKLISDNTTCTSFNVRVNTEDSFLSHDIFYSTYDSYKTQLGSSHENYSSIININGYNHEYTAYEIVKSICQALENSGFKNRTIIINIDSNKYRIIYNHAENKYYIRSL